MQHLETTFGEKYGEAELVSENLESFLKKHQVKNFEKTAQALKIFDVTVQDLILWREKEIEEIFKEANIEVRSRLDIFRALRNLPESCMYQEFQRNEKTSSQMVVLHPNEHEKMNRLYEKYKGISNSMNRLQEMINDLEENANDCKMKVKECHERLIEEIETYFNSLLINIDNYKIKKKDILLKQLEELKIKELQIKQWNDELNQYMTNSNLNVNERRDQILKLLQNPLIDSIQWNDTLLVESQILINTNIQPILQLIKDHIIIMEPSELKLEIPYVNRLKDSPMVNLKWNENIPEIWKNNCIFDIELLSMENNEIIEGEEQKNEDENENENENENEEGKEKEKNDLKIMENKWKRIIEIEPNKIKKIKNDITIDLNYQWKWTNFYALRMRAKFFDHLFFTPYSNIQMFYTGQKPDQTQGQDQGLESVIQLMFGSSILTPAEGRMLQSYLPKKNKNKSNVRLLLRGSRDGFSASTFHRLCDYEGPTITIINSNEHNHVFGGFTDISWSSDSGYKKDSESFIFLLRTSQPIPTPQKWTIKSGQEKHAVVHGRGHGPVFGGGSDFRIYDSCNTNSSNYSDFGVSYNGPRSRDILAGAYNFTVKDYEVYKVE